MERNYFLRFLVLLVTLSQGFAFSSDDRTADSLDHLVRKKRVIDRTPNADTRADLQDTFYVVNIKKNDVHACAGTILAAQIILTTVTCIEEYATYTVVSGTVSAIRGRGTSHRVTGILSHPRHYPLSIANDLALLSIYPSITFGRNMNRPIPIFESNTGQLPANTIVTVSGFGNPNPNRRGGRGCVSSGREQQRLNDGQELRKIRVPTLSRQECLEENNHNPIITNEIICTSHPLKSCSPGEKGNPLVYNDQLVGILVRDGFERETDLFISVARSENRNWILTHMSPENIPQYFAEPANLRHHSHRNPQDCSRVHPCDED